MSTVGLELEWADVDRWSDIPPHLGKWNDQDYSIVNSDGHANCPTGKTWRWGGEVNTRPTESAEEQKSIVAELARLLNPTVNYKCNLHVHVAPSIDLLDDLPTLKRVARELREAEPFVFETIDPMPKPTDPNELKRWRRNQKSHHGSIPILRWEEMCNAQTVQEFKDAHAPPTKTGVRAWHIVQRTGMNLRSLWKHGTIEFRHFFGSIDAEEIYDATRWCKMFIDAIVDHDPALTGLEVAKLIYENGAPWRFPAPKSYDHQLALGFEATKWKK